MAIDGQAEKQASTADEEPRDLPVRAVREKDVNTETEPGFTTAARMRLHEVLRDKDETTSPALEVMLSQTISELDNEEVEALFGPTMTVSSEDFDAMLNYGRSLQNKGSHSC